MNMYVTHACSALLFTTFIKHERERENAYENLLVVISYFAHKSSYVVDV